MKNSTNLPRRASIAIASAATFALLVTTAGTAYAATAVDLGVADSFVVLAGEGVTNTGPTTLRGDLGTSPNPSVTGAADITFASGTNYADGGPTADAKVDLVTAYDDAAGQTPTIPIAADLAGLTLVPGTYNSAAAIGLTGELTLDAEGDPDAVWVFQAGSELTVGSGATVTLINGAQACNVFWQVGSSASLGTGADFIGTIMALTSITLATEATVEGRVLARNGNVTMDTNTITRAVCAAPPDDNGDTGDTGTDGTTDDQVTVAPAGGVATGDGSTSGGVDGAGYLMIALATVAAVGATAVAAGWRRRSVRDL